MNESNAHMTNLNKSRNRGTNLTVNTFEDNIID